MCNARSLKRSTRRHLVKKRLVFTRCTLNRGRRKEICAEKIEKVHVWVLLETLIMCENKKKKHMMGGKQKWGRMVGKVEIK